MILNVFPVFPLSFLIIAMTSNLLDLQPKSDGLQPTLFLRSPLFSEFLILLSATRQLEEVNQRRSGENLPPLSLEAGPSGHQWSWLSGGR